MPSGPNDTDDADLHDTVNALCRARDWEEVLRLARASEPVEDGTTLWNVGWAAFKLDRLDEALGYLRRARDVDPQRGITHWALGVVYSEMGEYGLAEQSFETALALRDTFLVRRTYALLCLRSGDLEKGETLLREGLAARPGDPERILCLANFLFDVGRRDEAEVLYAQTG